MEYKHYYKLYCSCYVENNHLNLQLNWVVIISMVLKEYINILKFPILLHVSTTKFHKCIADLPVWKFISTDWLSPSERKQTHCFQIESLSCMSTECILCADHGLILPYSIQHRALKGHSCELLCLLSKSTDSPV